MLTRRTLLKTTAAGDGGDQPRRSPDNPLAPKAPHFPPKARRVIFLCMEGGPSHVDTFDHKPRLTTDAGRRFGDGLRGGLLLPPAWKFHRHGQSGLWISELFPEVARHADDLCVINSMQTDL